MFNYETAWDNLKKEINSKMEKYRSDTTESTAESIQGEKICKEILDIMGEMEWRAIAFNIVRNNSNYYDD